jgi:hypothetical protein
MQWCMHVICCCLSDELLTLLLSAHQSSLSPADVTSVSISKAPYLWNWLITGTCLVIVGVCMAIHVWDQDDDDDTTFQTPGIIVIVVGALLLLVFTYYACYPR